MKPLRASLVLSALPLAMAGVVHAHDADPYDDGWIAHVDDHRLEICYRSTPPAVGDTVEILRTSFITPNKGPIRTEYAHRGSARIMTALTSGGCLAAELVDGSAKRSDHARSLARR